MSRYFSRHLGSFSKYLGSCSKYLGTSRSHVCSPFSARCPIYISDKWETFLWIDNKSSKEIRRGGETLKYQVRYQGKESEIKSSRQHAPWVIIFCWTFVWMWHFGSFCGGHKCLRQGGKVGRLIEARPFPSVCPRASSPPTQTPTHRCTQKSTTIQQLSFFSRKESHFHPTTMIIDQTVFGAPRCNLAWITICHLLLLLVVLITTEFVDRPRNGARAQFVEQSFVHFDSSSFSVATKAVAHFFVFCWQTNHSLAF